MLGSSPRMRGALHDTVPGSRKDGIIPADAGSTRVLTLYGVVHPDHPRGCGEHLLVNAILPFRPKSSPRMRRALVYFERARPDRRIIPADAESTPRTYPPTGPNRDHPRECGEHIVVLIVLALSGGSSPRMRGARRFHVVVQATKGIIPANAGSTYHAPSRIE